MAEHINDYFINYNQRRREKDNIQGIINDSKIKLENSNKYIEELDNEIKKIEELKEKTLKKKEFIIDSKSKCEKNLVLYKDDILKLDNDNDKYIDNIIKSGILQETTLSEFNQIMNKYIEKSLQPYFIDKFGPHLHDHLKNIEIKGQNTDNEHDRRQIRKKSKKRSNKRSKKRR